MKASRYNKLLGVALGERAAQVAEVSTGASRPEARRMAEFAYPAGVSVQDPATLGEALGAFLREHSFGSRQAVIGLPAKWLLVKTKEVPPVDAATAADLLRLQAEGEFSSELRDLVFDYAGEPHPGKMQNVLLVATPRKYVDLAQQICEAAKLTPVAITSSAAAVGSVTARASSKSPVVLTLSPVGAELTAQNSGGHTTAVRHLRAPAPEALFLSELRRAVSMLPSTNGSANGSSTAANGSHGREMVVWDGAGLGEGRLGEQLGFPVRFGDLPSLGVTTADATRNGAGRKFGPAVALAVAALQGPASLPVDFLHSRLAPVPERRVKPWMAWSAVAAALVVVLAAAGYRDISNKETRLADTKAQLKDLTPRADKAKAFVSKVNVAQGFEVGDLRYCECLRDITTLLPDDGQTYVTNLSVKEKDVKQEFGAAASKAPKVDQRQLLVTITGKAPNQERAQDFIRGFVTRKDWFTDVKLAKVSVVQVGTGGRGGGMSSEAAFTMTCTFIATKPAPQ